MKNKPSTTLIYSGGLDSTVALYTLLNVDNHIVHALGFDYGQRHSRELDHAQRICTDLGLRYTVLHLPREFFGGSSQTDPSILVPHGHYEEESMKKTVVPNRNMVMLALATSYAISHKCNFVAYAAHIGDHAIYPDCRTEFMHAFENLLTQCDWNPPALYAPFKGYTKTDIVRRGNDLGVPFERTWSCYEGNEVHCGKCGTCVERREAFQLARITDPTEYAPEPLGGVIGHTTVFH